MSDFLCLVRDHPLDRWKVHHDAEPDQRIAEYMRDNPEVTVSLSGVGQHEEIWSYMGRVVAAK